MWKYTVTKRIKYLFATLILLAIEVMIAMFVHDKIIRPYVGDVLVVVVIYTFLRILIPEKCGMLPLYIFVFAAMAEVLQYFHIVERLGLEGNRFLSVLIGTVFDIKDIVCYGVGCLLLAGYEVFIWKRAEH